MESVLARSSTRPSHGPCCRQSAAARHGLARAICVSLRLGVALLLLTTVLSAFPGSTEAGAEAPGQPSNHQGELLILGFGDSLMAGYGLDAVDGFAARLERALRRRGLTVQVVNAGVSGETTSGGRARLAWTLAGLPRAPDLLILELGANDAMRGIDPAIVRDNLTAILTALKKRGIPVLLTGMRAPPSMGPDYVRRFESLYGELARRYAVCFDPFFLAGVAARPALNQADRIHPNARGVTRIVTRLAPLVEAALAGHCPPSPPAGTGPARHSGGERR